MGFKLEKEQDLGVIVKKELTGVMETNKGHKTMVGNPGDTLMQRTDRSTYVLTKEEVVERKADAKPTETAAAKKAREKAEVEAANIAAFNIAVPEVLTGTGPDAPQSNGATE